MIFFNQLIDFFSDTTVPFEAYRLLQDRISSIFLILPGVLNRRRASFQHRERLEHIKMPRKQAPQQSYAPPLPHSHNLVQLGAPQGSNNFLCKDALGEERLVEISKSLKRMKGLIVMRGTSSFLRKAGA